jgi:hypothetical protein
LFQLPSGHFAYCGLPKGHKSEHAIRPKNLEKFTTRILQRVIPVVTFSFD